jgi:hypothetical protein
MCSDPRLNLRTPNDLPHLVGAGEYYINRRITRGIVNHRTGLSFPDERGEKEKKRGEMAHQFYENYGM